MEDKTSEISMIINKKDVAKKKKIWEKEIDLCFHAVIWMPLFDAPFLQTSIIWKLPAKGTAPASCPK